MPYVDVEVSELIKRTRRMSVRTMNPPGYLDYEDEVDLSCEIAERVAANPTDFDTEEVVSTDYHIVRD